MADEKERRDLNLRRTLLDLESKLLMVLLKERSLPEHVRTCVPALTRLSDERLEKLVQFGFLSDDAQLAAAWILRDRESAGGSAGAEQGHL